MSGWNDSDRRDRLPANWATLVKQVKDRAKGRCEWRLPSGKRCPRAGRDVDHRRPGDDHRMVNLQLLCVHHHQKKTAREGQAGRYRVRKKFRRPDENHPGLRRGA